MASINKRKKDLLRDYVDFICEECHKSEDEVGQLEAHRIRRGCQGGTYEHRNVKMVCSSCHDKYEVNEFSQRRTR